MVFVWIQEIDVSIHQRITFIIIQSRSIFIVHTALYRYIRAAPLTINLDE